MSDEEPTAFAIARRALDDTPDDGGIDPELARRIIVAIWEYPYLSTACQACGITDRALESYLLRGVQADAPESLRLFARGVARADADKAKLMTDTALLWMKHGQTSGAKALLDQVRDRWGQRDKSIMEMLTSGKRITALKSRILKPSSLLSAMFKAALDEPNDQWRALLEETGWRRSLDAPEADGAREDAPDPGARQEPPEADDEAFPDG